MDWATGWDFNNEDDREMARRRFREQNPKVLIGSTDCIIFSTRQNLTPWSKDQKHLDFVCELHVEQINEGRWILHEHPASATSWQLWVVVDAMHMPGVGAVVGDQCQLGIVTHDGQGGWEPART